MEIPWAIVPMTSGQRALLVLSPIALGLSVPSLVLLAVQVIVGGIPFSEAISDVLSRMVRWKGEGGVIGTLIGLVPFLILAAQLHSYSTCAQRNACLSMRRWGLFGILALMIPGYAAVWYSYYGPGRVSSTAGLAFLFIPMYCVGSLFVGLLVGQFVTGYKWFSVQTRQGQCTACGYNLRGNTSGVCPECGHAIP